MPPPLNQSDIDRAYTAIAGRIRHTPVLHVRPEDLGLDEELPPVALKLEQLQYTGSFKARGALWSLLSREIPAAGIVAASGGNHGAAVAWAAQLCGVPAHIFVPEASAEAKRERIRHYGATLHVTGALYADTVEASAEFARETGAMSVHAYDAHETLAGQGTVGLEFLQDAALDTLLVATGGGGLIGGIAACTASRIKLVSVEPESAPTLAHALKAGHPVDAPAGGIAADSLAPRQVGALPFAMASAYVSAALTLPDAAIRAAWEFLWREFRIVAEPGGATALAALTSGAYRPVPGERVGVLICGGNTGIVAFPD